MRNTRWHAALLIATTALLVSCAGTSSEPGADPVTSSDSESGTLAGPINTDGPVETSGPAGADEDTATSTGPDERTSQPGVAAAMADLAERNAVALDEVTITELTAVTWRDGSLGCPMPGMQYSQALVPGQQLILSLASDPTQSFAYHAGARGTFSFCESPQPPVEGAPGST